MQLDTKEGKVELFSRGIGIAVILAILYMVLPALKILAWGTLEILAASIASAALFYIFIIKGPWWIEKLEIISVWITRQIWKYNPVESLMVKLNRQLRRKNRLDKAIGDMYGVKERFEGSVEVAKKKLGELRSQSEYIKKLPKDKQYQLQAVGLKAGLTQETLSVNQKKLNALTLLITKVEPLRKLAETAINVLKETIEQVADNTDLARALDKVVNNSRDLLSGNSQDNAEIGMMVKDSRDSIANSFGNLESWLKDAESILMESDIQNGAISEEGMKLLMKEPAQEGFDIPALQLPEKVKVQK